MGSDDEELENVINTVKDPQFTPNPILVQDLWKSFITLDTNDSITNQMLAMESYERSFGIQNINSKSPIALATMSVDTDCYTNSLLEKTIDRIISMKLFKITGMSVSELLDLPTYELKMIIRSVTKVSRKEQTIIDGISDELE